MDLVTSSREFHNFLSFYQVDHITSSPHHPQSNGFAEALVGITKKLMEKSVKEGKLWNYGLLQYRTTPISSTLPSPLEMLTGRKPHSSLPQLPSSIGHNMDTSSVRYCVPKFPHSSVTFNIILGSCILTSFKVLQGALGNSTCPMQCSQPCPTPANRHLTGLTWFLIVLYYIKEDYHCISHSCPQLLSLHYTTRLSEEHCDNCIT